ncbi:histidinol-phosphate transaminase [Marinibaculum pumilum]|uniref:Histidinol-phosphate aminotransferase n=1 Tax=Marinibaculum pumilum TaxID=1766165 RepID=A0ABV7L639_9PROT
MTLPAPRPGLMEITPYKGGESSAEGVARILKLSSNENPLGASPRAIAAIRAAAEEAHRYPDGGASRLRDAIAARYDLPKDGLICGNGSDELLSLLVHAYCKAGDEIVYSEHGFLMYALAAMANDVTPVKAPETELTADVDALLAAVTPKTRIVFLANPNNPTGSYLAESEVRRLREGLPDGVLLVIDAAYAEYVSRNDYEPGAALVAERDDTVMTRTFSKIHGLAALRLGWLYGPPGVVDVLHRVRGPFNVNAIAQAAGIAALADEAWLDKARAHNDYWLPELTAALTAIGLTVPPSVGNFLLLRFPGGADQAAAANAFLTKRGVLIRGMAAYGLAESLRATIGSDEENRILIDMLTEFMAGQAADG